MRYISLAVLLFAFWLLLSGIYKAHLIGLGIIATALTLWVVSRVPTIDKEGHPIELFGRAISYVPWLFWEVIKAAWSAARVIANPKLPITPTMTEVRGSQKTPIGIAIYGNSITLTPGTITTHVKGDVLTVHALIKENADDLEEGGMDRRVTQFEGEA